MNKTARETLIKKLVRVAFANPEKRAGCLEMIAKLAKQAGDDDEQELNEKNLVKYLKDHPSGVSVKSLAYAFGGTTQEHNKFLNGLVDKGVLVKNGPKYTKKAGEDEKAAEKPKKSAAAVTKAQVEKILKGEDYTFIDDYSGRGMEGANSPLAVTTDVSPTSEKGKKLLALGLSKDSLGKKFVYYLWASKNKKAALAKKLVRLAHANPEKRAEYLGMLAKLIPSS